ncbi:MAG: hypothetical protein ACEPOW_09280 [Bacteroidales bacterium]
MKEKEAQVLEKILTQYFSMENDQAQKEFGEIAKEKIEKNLGVKSDMKPQKFVRTLLDDYYTIQTKE